ncbi:hypothetical protein ACPOLB_20675 [Rubrivivax sp. RP6-9]|uniref:hypothetical protein n=1 Tax=Rubrivivax sp. RP6-9 TaxID=3415750 RepID=UPI003CC6CDE2
MPIWRIVAVATALVGYTLLSTTMMARWPDHPWSVAALFGPLLLALAIGGALKRHWPTLAACAGLALLLVLLVARGGADINRLYVLQHAAIHASLGWTFGMTLRPGATPLITLMAERVHSVFTPEMRAYTRWLTGAWVLFFAGMIVVSLLVYALAPWTWWSFFCGVLTPAAAVGFFVGEHLMRYRRHPEFERVTLAQAFRAYRASGS